MKTQGEKWDSKRYEQEKRRFIQRRIHLSPLWSQFTLIFAVSWGAAWLCSWFLWRFFANTYAWASSLPIRYIIAFLFAYGSFFPSVRIWIYVVQNEPADKTSWSDIFWEAAISVVRKAASWRSP
ncbi:MAG: hypothetical protein HY016_13360 [Nitrosomonadales bacterium]|nr:hypothetical protein [Nitrosomonadales bacterium]